MPTAKRLPSGSWRCRVYIGSGKYKSITVADPSRKGKKECERLASELSVSRMPVIHNLTVYDVVRKYIDANSPVLSPSTVRGYELYLRKRISPIQSLTVESLDRDRLQKWINGLSADCSPKYIKNVYGLLSSALTYSGITPPPVAFPSQAPKPLYTPCDADIRLLIDHIADRPQLLSCVLLAASGSLRRGEICALTADDLDGNRITVNKAMVIDADGYWHVKPMTKTDESNRTVVIPQQVADRVTLPIGLHPEQVTNRFRRAVRSCGCERKFRFHDLRHYYVSIAHALGVPDAYIMQMGGWKTDNVMKRVYRDTLPDVMQSEQEKMTVHFGEIFNS